MTVEYIDLLDLLVNTYRMWLTHQTSITELDTLVAAYEVFTGLTTTEVLHLLYTFDVLS